MKPIRIVVFAVICGVVLVVAVATYAGVTGIPAGVITRDLRATAEDEGTKLPIVAGWASMLSVMAWTASGASAVLSALLVPLRQRWLLVFSALLFVVAFDDALMLHELVGPAVGISQYAFYLVYLVTGGWLFYYSVRHFSDGTTLALAVSGAMLGLSAGIDILFDDLYLLEDGAKLVGAMVILAIAPLVLLSAHPTMINRISRIGQAEAGSSTPQPSPEITSG